MHYLAATLHTLGVDLSTRLTARATRYAALGTRRDRGSVTIQEVGWAIVAIAVIAVGAAAIRAYVTSKAGQIK